MKTLRQVYGDDITDRVLRNFQLSDKTIAGIRMDVMLDRGPNSGGTYPCCVVGAMNMIATGGRFGTNPMPPKSSGVLVAREALGRDLSEEDVEAIEEAIDWYDSTIRTIPNLLEPEKVKRLIVSYINGEDA